MLSAPQGTFGQLVYYDHDGVVAMASWQFCYQIDQDDLPLMAWDSVGHELPCQKCWESLHLVAQVTAFNVLDT